MALLTPITDDDARALVAAYGIEPLDTLEPLAAGSVNSNFALKAGQRRLFLRIYEERDAAAAEVEAAMVERLAAAGVPTPAPLRRLDGGLVSTVRGKPAALLPWRDGTIRRQSQVTADDTRRLGEALARVHVAGAREPREPGRFRYEDLCARLDRAAASADPRFEQHLPALRDALASAHAARPAQLAPLALPRGLIHGDLFRDNVLWQEGGDLAALLDFDSASDGTFAYDLMVTVLAWCVGDDLDARLARALREGYERVRPLEEAEKRGLAAEGAFASLRFAVTRITDFAMRTVPGGPPPARDWQRFMMRFAKLQALGEAGVRAALGA
jgi:homoserine kinase type II